MYDNLLQAYSAACKERDQLREGYEAMFRDLRARTAQLEKLQNSLHETKSEWTNIQDDEPPLYDIVLVTDGDFVDFGALQSDGSFCFSEGFLESGVTHWMYTPVPPKGD